MIGNCTVHLAHLPVKPSMHRVNKETLCLIDLYYHQKRISQGLVSFGPKLVTAVSEEAYLQTQLLMKSDSYLYFKFSNAIEEYLNDTGVFELCSIQFECTSKLLSYK